MRLARAIERFLAGYFATHERSDRTARAYTTDLRQFESFVGRSRTLRSLTPDVVEAWAGSLRAAGYQPTSAQTKAAVSASKPRRGGGVRLRS